MHIFIINIYLYVRERMAKIKNLTMFTFFIWLLNRKYTPTQNLNTEPPASIDNSHQQVIFFPNMDTPT